MGKEKDEIEECKPSTGAHALAETAGQQQQTDTTKNVTVSRLHAHMKTHVALYFDTLNCLALPVFLGKAEKQ